MARRKKKSRWTKDDVKDGLIEENFLDEESGEAEALKAPEKAPTHENKLQKALPQGKGSNLSVKRTSKSGPEIKEVGV